MAEHDASGGHTWVQSLAIAMGFGYYRSHTECINQHARFFAQGTKTHESTVDHGRKRAREQENKRKAASQ